jgi:hypothetical protein
MLLDATGKEAGRVVRGVDSAAGPTGSYAMPSPSDDRCHFGQRTNDVLTRAPRKRTQLPL